MTANRQAKRCLPFCALGSCSTLLGPDADRVRFRRLAATRCGESPEEPISFPDQHRFWEPLPGEERHGCTEEALRTEHRTIQGDKHRTNPWNPKPQLSNHTKHVWPGVSSRTERDRRGPGCGRTCHVHWKDRHTRSRTQEHEAGRPTGGGSKSTQAGREPRWPHDYENVHCETKQPPRRNGSTSPGGDWSARTKVQ